MQAQGELPHDAKLRSSKYLNNMIEQDHRNMKMRIGPMLGVQTLQICSDNDRGHRIDSPYSQGPVCTRYIGRAGASCACSLVCGTGFVIGATTYAVLSTLPENLHHDHLKDLMGDRRQKKRISSKSFMPDGSTVETLDGLDGSSTE
jgi:hypothetical protein